MIRFGSSLTWASLLIIVVFQASKHAESTQAAVPVMTEFDVAISPQDDLKDASTLILFQLRSNGIPQLIERASYKAESDSCQQGQCNLADGTHCLRSPSTPSPSNIGNHERRREALIFKRLHDRRMDRRRR